MRIYVASAFQDFPRTREAHAALARMGHTITHDWTIEANNGEKIPRRDRAASDLAGVGAADLLLVLTSERATRGTWCELGAALAWQKIVIVVGPQADLIFCDLAHASFATDAEAFAFMAERGSPGLFALSRPGPRTVIENLTINVNVTRGLDAEAVRRMLAEQLPSMLGAL